MLHSSIGHSFQTIVFVYKFGKWKNKWYQSNTNISTSNFCRKSKKFKELFSLPKELALIQYSCEWTIQEHITASFSQEIPPCHVQVDWALTNLCFEFSQHQAHSILFQHESIVLSGQIKWPHFWHWIQAKNKFPKYERASKYVLSRVTDQQNTHSTLFLRQSRPELKKSWAKVFCPVWRIGLCTNWFSCQKATCQGVKLSVCLYCFTQCHMFVPQHYLLFSKISHLTEREASVWQLVDVWKPVLWCVLENEREMHCTWIPAHSCQYCHSTSDPHTKEYQRRLNSNKSHNTEREIEREIRKTARGRTTTYQTHNVMKLCCWNFGVKCALIPSDMFATEVKHPAKVAFKE